MFVLMALATAGVIIMYHGSTPEWKGQSLKICHCSGTRSKSRLSAFLLASLAHSPSTCYIFLKFDMAIKLYYIRVGLQARDAFFGNMKQIYLRSPNLVDKFPAKVLLEAERRYAKDLACESVDKLSILSGWMAVMLEMEAANQGMVYTYHAGDWNRWMSGDHVEEQGKSEDISAVGVTRTNVESTHQISALKRLLWSGFWNPAGSPPR
ncbi:hypothetical protein EDD18DRAFT_1098552 [Armillaria luteobubalina]|uniref:Uncharacterized protein n=1 Tax=Armillaria luteobubalina TaxID=153913 RepID=A0AA39QLI1_9AGAR|nr:hypothetical protein EDD18DRAFT_1098552 [Armillaria luteobubalina]